MPISTGENFLSIEHVTVRYLDRILFNNLSFCIKRGEQWAVTGPGGSGKSALLQTVLGRYNVVNGSIHYHFFSDYAAHHAITDPLFNFRHLIASVGHHPAFRNRSNMPGFYYQQRFHAGDSDDAPTVREYLQQATVAAGSHVAEATARFSQAMVEELLQMTSLLDKTLIKLSNGETRRLMIAEALLRQPELLLLDNPFTGLDVQMRAFFHELLGKIVAAGVTIVMVTSPHEIPAAITHVLELDNGAVKSRTTREAFLRRPATQQAGKNLPATVSGRALTLLMSDRPALPAFRDAVRMENVHVQYGDTVILDHVDWTVRRGEKWALLGPNGAGKSTLLSLITGDNPQAYANRIYLFDKKRGSGESIWDIKRRIGFVSPEMHQYFTSESSGREVVLSGFFDTMGLQRKPSEEQLSFAERWMEVLSVGRAADKKFKQAAVSEQRLLLLARALVKSPPLLILDEPCQGLDDRQRDHFREIAGQVCDHTDTTLIYVSHYREEIPGCVTRLLRLEKGVTAYCGSYPP